MSGKGARGTSSPPAPERHSVLSSHPPLDGMDIRISILSASVGALLLTTAPSPIGSDAGEDPPSQEGVPLPSKTCAVGSLDATTDPAPVGRLSAAYGTPDSARAAPAAPPVDIEEPTLWLARAIYSETKLPHEQELVAWVVRNRVETAYRGKNTYREVVLDPYQFSAFNPGSSKRSLLMHLEPETPLPQWQQALWIAYYVRHADPIYRPFSRQTRHFFSERSMMGRPKPFWARRHRFVSPGRDYQVDEHRFRFYEEISS